MSLSALPTVLLGTVLAFPILEHFPQWRQGNEVLDQRLWTPRYPGRPQPLRGDPSPQIRSKHVSGNQGTPWTLTFLVSSWMFSWLSFFPSSENPPDGKNSKEAFTWVRKYPRWWYPGKELILLNSAHRGVLSKKQGVLLFNRSQCFFSYSWCPWCGERLRAGGEGGDRGRDGWMASPTQCTWAWASSGKQWRTRRPGVLQYIGSRRVGHGLLTEQQQYYFNRNVFVFMVCAEMTPSGQAFPVRAPQQLPSFPPLGPDSLGLPACQPIFLFLAYFLPPSDKLIFPLSPFPQNLLKLL